MANTYQVPKKTHPWRQYKNRFEPLPEEEEALKNLPSLKKFLTDIVENWDTYSIPSGDFGDGYAKIKSVPDNKAAEWLMVFIKRTWVRKSTGTFIEEYA